MLPFLISPRFCKEKATSEPVRATPAGPGGARGAPHRLGDVGLPPVRVLQGVALGVGQAPPAATGGRSQRRTASAGGRRARQQPGGGLSGLTRGLYSRVADVLEHRGEGLGLQARGRPSAGLRGRGKVRGVPGGTCWSSMSCGMAPTIWMAIFTTSLGGGMAPAAAPSPLHTARLPAPPAPQFRVAAAASPPPARPPPPPPPPPASMAVPDAAPSRPSPLT